MRKLFLLAALLVSIGFSYAQISLGVKAGTNANTVSFEDDQYTGSEYKFGFHAGVFSKIKLSKRWSLIPELQYIRKGYKDKSDLAHNPNTGLFQGHRNNYDVTLDYIELPVALSYSPVRFLSLEWGWVFGQMISAKGHGTLDDRPFANMSEFFNKHFESGWCGGLRFNLPAGLGVAARYYHGVTRTSDYFMTEDGDTGAFMYQRNRNFQLSVYYAIRR